MKNLEGLKTLLFKPKKIFITTHPRPDADALGSSLGLANYLKKYGHDVTVVTPTSYPQFIAWMKGNEEVIIYKGNETIAKQKLDEANIIFCLDFCNLNRIDELGDLIREKKNIPKVLIDHHIDPEKFAEFELWSSDASATAELIYDFIIQMEDDDKIDVDIAECIYAGIMTDTGSFRFPATSPKVHLIIAELIKKGVENAKIHRLVYDNNSETRLRFLGHCLSNLLVVRQDLGAAYIAISLNDKKKYNAQLGDTEGIVNYALSIKGIKFATMIKEEEGIVKFSFRSVGDFSVNEFARDNFNGGGHKNAAGGRSDLSFNDTIVKFEELLERYKDEIIKS